MDLTDDTRMVQLFDAAIGGTSDSLAFLTMTEFNLLLKTFLTKLQVVYQSIPALATEIQTKQVEIETIVACDKEFFVKHFYALISPHISEENMADEKRDEFIEFILPRIPILQSLQIDKYWEQTEEPTRQAIWEYIKQLWSQSYCYHNQPTPDVLRGHAMAVLQAPGFQQIMQNLVGRLTPQGIPVDQGMIQNMQNLVGQLPPQGQGIPVDQSMIQNAIQGALTCLGPRPTQVATQTRGGRDDDDIME